METEVTLVKLVGTTHSDQEVLSSNPRCLHVWSCTCRWSRKCEQYTHSFLRMQTACSFQSWTLRSSAEIARERERERVVFRSPLAMSRFFSKQGCLEAIVSRDFSSRPGELVSELFDKFSSNGVVHASHFRRFLTDIQHEPQVSETFASEIMTSQPGALPGPQFSQNVFFNYLFNTHLNYAINNFIHHEMTLPLSHYFIFTGHNSYLTGNQLRGTCSEKPIAEALRKGVRVVELDLWPNQHKDDILVVHGRTFTAPVAFQKCLAAIKESAFIKSEYPVIITLEDHLPSDLQAKAAKVIVDTFGSQLFYPGTEEELKQFHSPEALKRMILISTKPPKEYLHSASIHESPKHAEQDLVWEEATSEAPMIDQSESHDLLSDEEELNGMQEECSDEATSSPEHRQDRGVSPEYKRIIAIRAGKKCKSLKNALKVEENAKRVSLSEPKLSKIAESHRSMVVQFTRNNILRIYPKGTRVNSSNYNPMKAWSCGAQMVAINMQGFGKHLWVTQGLFRANGGCGYVKKPSFLMSGSDGFCSESLYSKDASLEVKQHLKVKVCMGFGWREELGVKHFDKLSAPDFYARVGIAGVKTDKALKETATIKDVWEPNWQDEFHFTLRIPELAVLRIEVYDADKAGRDKFAGQIYLPISELKSGYRVVSLCDKKGNEWKLVKLLLHLQLMPPSPDTR